jgi:hypothetical protein
MSERKQNTADERRHAIAKQIEALTRRYTDTTDRFSLQDCVVDLAFFLKTNFPEESYLQAARRELNNHDRRKRPRPNQLEMFPHDRWIPIDSARSMRIRLGDARKNDLLSWMAIAADNIAKQNAAYATLAAETSKWLSVWAQEKYSDVVKLSELQQKAFGWMPPTNHDDGVDDGENSEDDLE